MAAPCPHLLNMLHPFRKRKKYTWLHLVPSVSSGFRLVVLFLFPVCPFTDCPVFLHSFMVKIQMLRYLPVPVLPYNSPTLLKDKIIPCSVNLNCMTLNKRNRCAKIFFGVIRLMVFLSKFDNK
jgi:hypothetical protein